MAPVVLQAKQKQNFTALRTQKGSTLVECGICIALVALVCISATAGMGRSISNLFQRAYLPLQGGGFEGVDPPGGGMPGGGEGEG